MDEFPHRRMVHAAQMLYSVVPGFTEIVGSLLTLKRNLVYVPHGGLEQGSNTTEHDSIICVMLNPSVCTSTVSGNYVLSVLNCELLIFSKEYDCLHLRFERSHSFRSAIGYCWCMFLQQLTTYIVLYVRV